MDFLDAEARAPAARGRRRRRRRRASACGSTRRWCSSASPPRPSSSRCTRWNPEHNLHIGGDRHGLRLRRQRAEHRRPRRRPPARQPRPTSSNLLKLGQMLNIVHFVGGYPVEPIDLHAVGAPPRRRVRRADAHRQAHPLLQPRPPAQPRLHRDGAHRPRQVDDATLEREPSIFTVINSISPLRLDTPMLHGIIEMASRNQAVVMTPFTLAGAMAPVTLAGARGPAERRGAGRHRLHARSCGPGAPVVYGGFTSNVDMQSGAPAFGTPEYVRTAMLGGQLARRYKRAVPLVATCARPTRSTPRRPTRACSRCGARDGRRQLDDARRRLDGGRAARQPARRWCSTPTCCTWSSRCCDPIVVDDDTLAIDAIDEVGPGGHFFGVGHTQERYRTAFYQPMISDWRNYETLGTRPAAPRPPARPTSSPQRSSPPTSRRRWTPRVARSSTPSSPAASPRAASPPISRRTEFRGAQR